MRVVCCYTSSSRCPCQTTTLRYLFVINHAYLPRRVGGAESTIHELCLGLKREGFQCGVLSRYQQRNTDPRSTFLTDLRSSIGKRAFWFRKYSHDNDLGYPVYRSQRRQVPVRQVIQSFGPDVAVLHPNRRTGVAKSLLDSGVPVILYVQDVEFHTFECDLEPAPGKHFMANSKFTAGRLKDKYGIDAHVVPPLVDRKLHAVDSTRSKVVMVNPHPKKGVDIAFGLARRRPDVQFEFFEAWPMPRDLRAELTAVVQKLPNVLWHSHVLDSRKLYAEARIVLAPSRWDEGWGRVVTEAQLNGIPVLASNRGNLADTVGPGGIVLDPDADISVWCNALGDLWDRVDVYDKLVHAALRHARRASIQPEVVMADFIRFSKSCATGVAGR